MHPPPALIGDGERINLFRALAWRRGLTRLRADIVATAADVKAQQCPPNTDRMACTKIGIVSSIVGGAGGRRESSHRGQVFARRGTRRLHRAPRVTAEADSSAEHEGFELPVPLARELLLLAKEKGPEVDQGGLEGPVPSRAGLARNSHSRG
jgi:hypothetical protein